MESRINIGTEYEYEQVWASQGRQAVFCFVLVGMGANDCSSEGLRFDDTMVMATLFLSSTYCHE